MIFTEQLEQRRLLSGAPRLVADLDDTPGDKGASVIGKVNDVLLFVHNDGIHGEELWRSDATGAGTTLLKDMTPGAKDSTLEFLGNAGKFAYLLQGYNPGELWRTDGTAEGTVRLSVMPEIIAGMPVARKFYFSNSDHNHRGTALWVTDGTTTTKLKDVSVLGKGIAFQGKYFFFSGDAEGITSIWRSDGTTAGTQEVADVIAKFDGDPRSGYPRFAIAGDSLFLVKDEWRKKNFASRILKFTGEAFESLWAGHRVRSFGSIGNKLYFSTVGGQLWRTDGTASGFKLLWGNDVGPISDEYYPSQGATDRLYFGDFGDAFCVKGDRVTKINARLGTRIGKLLYYSKDGEIWRSDGSADGTFKIAEYDREPSFYAHFNKLGTKVMINAEEEHTLGEYHQWVWSTNGTEAGTQKLVDQQIEGRTTLTTATIADRYVYFISRKNSGEEMWTTDGTGESIHKIKTLLLPSLSSAPNGLKNIGGKLFFTTQDADWFQDDRDVDYPYFSGRFWVVSPGGEPKLLMQDVGSYSGVSVFDGRAVVTGGGVWIGDAKNETFTSVFDTTDPEEDDVVMWTSYEGHRGGRFYFSEFKYYYYEDFRLYSTVTDSACVGSSLNRLGVRARCNVLDAL